VTFDPRLITGISVSRNDVTVEQLEAVTDLSQCDAVATLLAQEGVREAFVLQSCHRFEVYVVTRQPKTGGDAFDTVLDGIDQALIEKMDHKESLRHLLRVSAGLDSLVLGEDQILGQVSDAYEDARSVGGIGPVLEAGVTKAIRVGKRARTETAINEGVVSVAGAAVQLASEQRALENATGLIIGAGEMGMLAANSFEDHVESLLVANRTVTHAVHLAEQMNTDACAIGLDALSTAVAQADVVISATGSASPIVGQETLADAGETLLIDIAQPRDVAPTAADFEHVTLYSLNQLESVTEKTRHQRERAVERVEALIDDEFKKLLAQYKRKRADRIISAMYKNANRVKTAELQTALSKLDLDDDEQAVVESMADAIVSELFAAPTNGLRDAAADDHWETIQAAVQLFDPNHGSNEGMSLPSNVTRHPEERLPDTGSEEPIAVFELLDD
jgi:glutamyl-tRNA reductase